MPEFGIVQRVERKSPFRDLMGKAKASETPQVVEEWQGRAYTALVSDQHPLISAVAVSAKRAGEKAEDGRVAQRHDRHTPARLREP